MATGRMNITPPMVGVPILVKWLFGPFHPDEFADFEVAQNAQQRPSPNDGQHKTQARSGPEQSEYHSLGVSLIMSYLQGRDNPVHAQPMRALDQDNISFFEFMISRPRWLRAHLAPR